MASKNPCRPERSTLAACSAASPLVNRISRCRLDRYARVSGTPSRIFGGVLSSSLTIRATCSTVFRLAICRSEEHTSELQSRLHLVCRLLLEKKKTEYKHRPERT